MNPIRTVNTNNYWHRIYQFDSCFYASMLWVGHHKRHLACKKNCVL